MNWSDRLAAFRWMRDARAGFGLTFAAYVAVTAVLAPIFRDAELLNVALGYLLLTLLVSAAWGYASGLAGAILADLLVNFFFVAPRYTLTVQDPSNVVGLVIYLATGLLGASMLALLRRQAQLARAGRAETAAILSLTQEVARAISPRDALDRLCFSAMRSLHTRGCAVIWQGPEWEVLGSSGGMNALGRHEAALADAAVSAGDIVRNRPTPGSRMRPVPGEGAPPHLTIVPFGPAAPERGVLYLVGRVTARKSGIRIGYCGPSRMRRAWPFTVRGLPTMPAVSRRWNAPTN